MSPRPQRVRWPLDTMPDLDSRRLQALFEKSDDLDLWHGGTLEGGNFVRLADKQLSEFIANHQDLYLMALAQEGRPVKSAGIEAVAEQGGKKAAMAMIANAGATAHKGVDLLVTASRKVTGPSARSPTRWPTS